MPALSLEKVFVPMKLRCEIANAVNVNIDW
jgi:hypothetical protein